MGLHESCKTDKFLADITWKRLWLSALELKRALDRKTLFDFSAKIETGRVLLVGEGNLSFSLALARMVGVATKNMTCTTYQQADEYSEMTCANASVLRRSGAMVMSGVDATNLSNWFGRSKFDLIVFQFPNVASRNPLYGRNPNHILVRRFLKSAAEQISGDGIVAVSAANSPHYAGAFDVDGAAERNEYEMPVAYPFYFSDYPGYSHAKTKDDGSSAVGEGDEFVTYVFHKKKQVARKWVLR